MYIGKVVVDLFGWRIGIKRKLCRLGSALVILFFVQQVINQVAVRPEIRRIGPEYLPENPRLFLVGRYSLQCVIERQLEYVLLLGNPLHGGGGKFDRTEEYPLLEQKLPYFDFAQFLIRGTAEGDVRRPAESA